MHRAAIAILLLASAAFPQASRRLDYALILEDEPVARRVNSRAAMRGSEASAHRARIAVAQRGVVSELRARRVEVVGTAQELVNAVLVHTTRERAQSLREIPGVKGVVPAPPLKLDMDRALTLANVQTAWGAVGGAGAAGAGIKIGILDSGIDQAHPAFQDPTLQPPNGYPKGDTAYTNNKVIVARSYNQLNADALKFPDDISPRDRQGHGTAIAMIAAGVPNTGPNGVIIQGVAPKAFLGNYKIAGSPGIHDFARFAAFNKALEDALADGMDIVNLSVSEGSPAFFAPLDVENAAPPQGCGGPCDIYSQAVENAVAKGMVVVTSAGNSGNIGHRVPTLTSIHRPGTAPSAITVGATMNSHVLYQSVRITGTNVPSSLQNIRALVGDGPQKPLPLTAPVRAAGGDGLACAALPGGSLSGAIALIQRGTCDFVTKINNAQTAGAAGVILFQSAGEEQPFGFLSAWVTGIPAVMIGNSDGNALRTYAAANANAQATLDPAWTASNSTADVIWPSSSRGPSPGLFGATAANAIKPELVAPGANIYSATQKLDPNSYAYNASGYGAFSGTSYAVPMVAGAVALVKQKYPAMTPAQLKSAVVNTANPEVIDETGTAGVNSRGAGKLNAADAVNVTATFEPSTIHFGALPSTTVDIGRTMRIVRHGSSSPLTFRVEERNPASGIQVEVSADGTSVRLRGNRPAPGSYEGFIVVTGAGPAMRIPYQYLVAAGAAADVYPIGNAGFVGGTGDVEWEIDARVIDQYGVPVVGVPLRFNVVSGGGTIPKGDEISFRLGNAAALVNLGSREGDQIFNVVVGGPGGLTTEFFGYAREYPDIPNGAVSNAASGQGGGLAPGSYISIYGTALSDAFQLEPTAELPVSLSGVAVSFYGGGLELPGGIHFVSPGQVNTQIPWEYQGQSSVEIILAASGLPSFRYTLPLATYSPGLFENFGIVAAQDAGYNNLGQNRPARRGQAIILYANGLGPLDNTPASRFPSSTQQLARTRIDPTVTIGNVNASVLFSGLTPGVVGLYQVNVEVPPNAPTGAQPVVVTIGGVSSKAATLYVQ